MLLVLFSFVFSKFQKYFISFLKIWPRPYFIFLSETKLSYLDFGLVDSELDFVIEQFFAFYVAQLLFTLALPRDVHHHYWIPVVHYLNGVPRLHDYWLLLNLLHIAKLPCGDG